MSHLQKSKTAKVVAGFVGFAMALSFAFTGAVSPANAQSASDLAAQIQSLLATIQQLQARLNAVQGGSTGTTGGSYSFSVDLQLGSRGTDVMNLQKVLNSSSDTQVAVTGAGSPGNESSYFGPATRAAVRKFQAKNGISSTGYVGPLTRGRLNSMGGGVVVTPPTCVVNCGGVSGGALTVASAIQPSPTLAPQSAARVPFTRITLTAGGSDVQVNNITVERDGLSADAAFAGVVLLDDNGVQMGSAKTFNSIHQANVGDPFIVRAGTSRTLTIAGNMAGDNSSRNGQTASLSVVAVNTNGASVGGILPIMGATHTINSSLTIGTVTVARGSLDPAGAQTKSIGSTNLNFSSIQITAGSAENVRLSYVRWNQASSSGPNDLANVRTTIDGVDYPAVVSNDGKYYTSTFGSGIVIAKGNNKEIAIKGDVVGGSTRTVAFNIEKPTDVGVTGETFNYGISMPTNGANSSAQCSGTCGGPFGNGSIWYAGSTLTIDKGSITIEKAVGVPAQNVAVNLAGQPLGGFTADVKGEQITVASLTFTIATTGTKTAGSDASITNVTIVDQNGKVVAGPVDASGTGTTLTFTDTILFPIAKGTYTLKGKVGPGFGSDGTVIISTTPSSQWSTVTGQVTNSPITPSSATVTMNTMTVKNAALTISVSTDPAAQTVVSGAQQFTFANYQLSALSSGEDIRLNAFPAELNAASGATNLTNCALYDGGVQLNTGSNVINPSAQAS
ncbi:peptidoglycan-binding protein, partial [Candidatus Parcubacteria bacterium]|nr:peptidoglycan-binding protein [Candidatus Parcubacteria bacterium]